MKLLRDIIVGGNMRDEMSQNTYIEALISFLNNTRVIVSF